MTWDHIPAEEARMMHGVWAMEDARTERVIVPPSNTPSLYVQARERLVRSLQAEHAAALTREMQEAKERAITLRGSDCETLPTGGSFEAGNV